jgi:ABC-2 type transport system permease protein
MKTSADTTVAKASAPAARCPSPEKTLRQLFLTLFLRGRSARGLQKEKAPKSVGTKLAWTLLFYAAFGLLAIAFATQPLFALSAYLHAMTFVFLGMFIASSAGEILFNKEEADILLHRPIAPRALLWAKIRVLVEVSLWLAMAFNLCGFAVGAVAPHGSWIFPFSHVASTALQAMFCTGCVVMVYQLCLRWFGRERLDGLMTTAQVLISVGAVMSGQILPQMLTRFNVVGNPQVIPWWIALLPPAWFAGFDDAIAGSHALFSWLLAALGVIATAVVLWLSFGVLARDYEVGLQALNETTSTPKKAKSGRKWLERFVELPLVRSWLSDPVSRASFLLTSAYLIRDRDVKLRVYPAIAPIMIMPLFMVMQPARHGSGGGEFGLAFAGAYAGLVPMLGLSMLQYSQQWRAADIFRAAPIAGPATINHGARRAVMCFLAAPSLIGFVVLGWLTQADSRSLLLLIPGLIAMPVYSILPSLVGTVPLSQPSEEAKSASRGLTMVGIIFLAIFLAVFAMFAWQFGYYWQFLVGELLVMGAAYAILRRAVSRKPWPATD